MFSIVDGDTLLEFLLVHISSCSFPAGLPFCTIMTISFALFFGTPVIVHSLHLTFIWSFSSGRPLLHGGAPSFSLPAVRLAPLQLRTFSFLFLFPQSIFYSWILLGSFIWPQGFNVTPFEPLVRVFSLSKIILTDTPLLLYLGYLPLRLSLFPPCSSCVNLLFFFFMMS